MCYDNSIIHIGALFQSGVTEFQVACDPGVGLYAGEIVNITKQNKQRHQEGVALAKNSGKYAGRKKIVVDPNLFRQIAEDFRNHKVTEEEAMHRAGISSRSTFYRRLKEM